MGLKNKLTNSAIDFNKEILFGQIGAIIAAPLFAYFISLVSSSPSIISYFTVFGSIFGGGLFWFSVRVYNQKKKNEFSLRKMTGDIAYYSPAALLTVLLIYNPILFFLTKHLIENEIRVVFSVILAQFIAFSLFLLTMNIYRVILIKFFNKRL